MSTWWGSCPRPTRTSAPTSWWLTSTHTLTGATSHLATEAESSLLSGSSKYQISAKTRVESFTCYRPPLEIIHQFKHQINYASNFHWEIFLQVWPEPDNCSVSRKPAASVPFPDHHLRHRRRNVHRGGYHRLLHLLGNRNIQEVRAGEAELGNIVADADRNIHPISSEEKPSNLSLSFGITEMLLQCCCCLLYNLHFILCWQFVC